MLSKSPDDFTLGLQAMNLWVSFWAMFALSAWLACAAIGVPLYMSGRC